MLFQNRGFVFAGGHFCKDLKAFGKILGIVKAQKIRDLGHVVVALTNELSRLFHLQLIVVVHDAVLLIGGK